MTQQFLIVGDYDPFNLDGDVGHGCDVFMWQSGGGSTPAEPGDTPTRNDDAYDSRNRDAYQDINEDAYGV